MACSQQGPLPTAPRAPRRPLSASSNSTTQLLESLLAEFAAEGCRRVPQKHLTRFQLSPELLEQRVRPLLMEPPASRAQAVLRHKYIEVGGGSCCCCRATARPGWPGSRA
jgi:hypothetical protein